MKALVYHGPHNITWEDKPKPTLLHATDAIVRITTTTLCGTDLHILKGDVPSVGDGRVLGHEGVGVVEQVGDQVQSFKQGDPVLISLITSCGRCRNCKKAMFSHCLNGGWQLGNRIDGTQAEFVRIPYADTGLHLLPPNANDEAAVMLSCIFPTGLECGILSGQVKLGDSVAIVGDGPVGLATLMLARLYSPSDIFMIGRNEHRLQSALSLGASQVINNADGKAVDHVMSLTRGAGVDVAMEAVGVPETFGICQEIIAAGGRIANMGVHACPVPLRLETLWSSNITITTRLVDAGTTALLLKMVQSGNLPSEKLVSHRFALSDILKAYDTFANAQRHCALKVVLRSPALG